MRQFFVFCSLLLLFAGCTRDPAGPDVAGGATDTEVAFNGTVRLQGGAPAASISVKVYANYQPLAQDNLPLGEATTDQIGHYSFEGLPKGAALTVVGTDGASQNGFFAQETLTASRSRVDTLKALGRLTIAMDTAKAHTDGNYLTLAPSVRHIPLDSQAVKLIDTLPEQPYLVNIAVTFGDSTFRDSAVCNPRLIRWALVGMVYEYLGYLIGPSQPVQEVVDPLFGNIPFDGVPLGASLCRMGDTLFFIGGYDERMNTSNRAMFYLLSTETWENASTMEVPMFSPGAVLVDGTLRVMGGFGYEGDHGTVQLFETSTSTFELLGEIPDTLLGFDGTNPRLYAVCMGKVYTVSTSSRGIGFSLFESSDGLTWTRFDKLNVPRPFGSSANAGGGIRNSTVFQVNGKVFFLGGRDADNNLVMRTTAYDFNRKAWIPQPYLSAGCEMPAIASLQGSLFAFEALDNGATLVENLTASDDRWHIRGIVADTLDGFSGRNPNFLTVCDGRFYAVSNGGDRLTVYESVDGIRWIAHVSTFGSSYEPVILASGISLYILAGDKGEAPNRFYEFNTQINSFTELPAPAINQDAKYNTCWSRNRMVFKLNSCADGVRYMEIYDMTNRDWSLLPVPLDILFSDNRRYSVVQPDSAKTEVFLFNPQTLGQGFYFNYQSFKFTAIVQEAACLNPVIVASDSMVFVLSTGDNRRSDLFTSFSPRTKGFSDRKLPSIRRNGQFNCMTYWKGLILRLNSSALGANVLETYNIVSNQWTALSAPDSIDFTNDGLYSAVAVDSTQGKFYWFENSFRIPGFFYNCNTQTFGVAQ